MSLRPMREILPGVLSQICGGTPGRVRTEHQQRWGLRNMNTGGWYSPVSLVHKQCFPMSFGCRAEALAVLRVMGSMAPNIWRPEPFSDEEYAAAIAASEGK